MNYLKVICTTGVVALLAACGGSNSGSTGATSVAGKIVGFGSIYLDNGKRYDSSSIDTCEIDDQQISGDCQQNLSVGQYVRFKTDANGKIESLSYDDDIEGPATNVVVNDNDFEFTVFGVTVTTSTSTQWKDFTSVPATAADLEGVEVEISGEWVNSILLASYVERQGDSDSSYEMKGTVGNISGTTFDLSLKDGSTISVDSSSTGYVPVEGDYVEVEGSYDGITFTASKVEVEDHHEFDHDGEVEITGTLSCNSGLMDCQIRDAIVDISAAASCQDMVDTRVELKGYYDQTSGVLLAEYCESEDDELEVKCDVHSVDVPDVLQPKVGSLVCGFSHTSETITVEFSGSPNVAMFSDDSSSSPVDLTQIQTGECVEIEASSNNSGGYVAGYIELEHTSSCSSYKLEGPVDSITATEITLMGVTFQHDTSTIVKDSDISFVQAGDFVKIKDDNADGVLSKIKIED